MAADVDVVVVGAGISGLTAAYRLQGRGATVEVLDAGKVPGGVMSTRRRDGCLYETGPNSTLDTTPLVGPDAAYCKKIGFTDGRSYCPVRTEGSADRAACETYAIGKAKDTGRPGPTWYRNGKLCTGQSTDCENHPDNQYLLWAFGDGLYEACTKDDVCGSEQVDR